MSKLVHVINLIVWIAGIIFAKGFWSTLAAVLIVPFWSYYLVIDKILTFYNLI